MPAKKAATKVELEPRSLVIWGEGKFFTIEIPGHAKTTFAPFSPPRNDARGYPIGGHRLTGTLRVYGKSEKECLGVFSGVEGFYDTQLDVVELEASMMDIPEFIKGKVAPKAGKKGKGDDEDGIPF